MMIHYVCRIIKTLINTSATLALLLACIIAVKAFPLLGEASTIRP